MADKKLGILTLDNNQVVVRGPVRRTMLNPRGFPTPAPPSGVPATDNYLPHRIMEYSSPLSIGLQRGRDSHRVWDMANISAQFPNLVTLGPLKQTPTWSGGPDTFKAAGRGFVIANNTLFMMGVGAASGDEPLWYLDGTTWTSCTLNADASADVVTIVDVVYLKGVYYAIGDQLLSNGTYNRISYQSTNKTTWTEFHTAADAETLPGSADRVTFLDSPADTFLNIIAYVSTNYRINFGYLTATATTANKFINANGVQVSWAPAQLDESEGVPRDLKVFPGSDGIMDYILATNRAVWWMDVSTGTISKLIDLKHPEGTYTGRLAIGTSDYSIWVADGPNLVKMWWTEIGGFQYAFLGPEGEAASIMGEWNGLPVAKTGDITAICSSKDQPWIYFAKGGLAASRNAWIGRINTKTMSVDVPYQNATAQRAITAMVEFNKTLHILEEQAAGGDQDPFYFSNVANNPDNDTTFAYAASGTITLSRFDGYVPALKKGFFDFTVQGDGMGSNEKVTAKFAKNGGSLKTGQDITSNGGSVWVDMVSGTHTGSNNASVLTDSAAAFVTDGVQPTAGLQTGDTVSNTTDGSSGTITAVTATTVTATLSGGSDNDWDTSDAYTIIPARGLEAYDIYAELTLARGGTTTNAPKLRAFSYSYDLKALKRDGTPAYIYEAVVSRNPKDYEVLGVSPESVLSNFDTTFGRNRLVAMAYNPDRNTTRTAKVELDPYAIEEHPLDKAEQGAAGTSGPLPDFTIRMVEVL